jgi:hypothetical protein
MGGFWGTAVAPGWGGGNRRYFPLHCLNNSSVASGAALAIDLLYGSPFVLPFTATADSLAVHVQAGVATAVGRIGIYDSDAAGNPRNLIVDSGQLNVAGIGVVAAAVNVQLRGGALYWQIWAPGVAAANLLQVTNGLIWPGPLGLSPTDFTVFNARIAIARAFAALPNPWPAGVISMGQQTNAMVCARFASIP